MQAGSQVEEVAEEADAVDQMTAENAGLDTAVVESLPEGAKINLLAPRGMKLLTARLLESNSDATISWVQRQKAKSAVITASGRGRKVCELLPADLEQANFQIA